MQTIQLQGNMPVLRVGPLGLAPGLFTKNVSMEGLQLSDEAKVLNWSSVLSVSFGTTGLFNLAKCHVTELANGLKPCGQRYVWVVRVPPGVDEEGLELLPEGVEDRVESRGLRDWAPQLKSMAHPSTTGAFFEFLCLELESLALLFVSSDDQPVVARLVVKLFMEQLA